MSIQNAIITATKDILSSYLAPELVEQLSDDIMHRAAPEIEAALSEFAGFDFGKGASRGKAAAVAAGRTKASSKAGRKRRDSTEHHDAAESHDEPADAMVMQMGAQSAEPAAHDMT